MKESFYMNLAKRCKPYLERRRYDNATFTWIGGIKVFGVNVWFGASDPFKKIVPSIKDIATAIREAHRAGNYQIESISKFPRGSYKFDGRVLFEGVNYKN